MPQIRTSKGIYEADKMEHAGQVYWRVPDLNGEIFLDAAIAVVGEPKFSPDNPPPPPPSGSHLVEPEVTEVRTVKPRRASANKSTDEDS